MRRARRLDTETHTQAATHNKPKNSVWTGGSHLTLVGEEEREWSEMKGEGEGASFWWLLALF